MKDRWVRQEGELIWWLDNASEVTGEMVISFDRKKKLNLFRDYPDAFSAEEKAIFDRENPFWAEYFKERVKP